MLLGGYGFRKSGSVYIPREWGLINTSVGNTRLSYASSLFDTEPQGFTYINNSQVPIECGPRFSPDKTKLAVGFVSSPFFAVFNVVTNTKLSDPATLPTNSVVSVAWNPSGTRLAVAQMNPTTTCIHVYDTSSWARVCTVAPAEVPYVTDMAFTPDGTKLAIATYSDVRVVDATPSSGAWVKINGPTLRAGSSGAISVCCPTNDRVVYGGRGGTPYIWTMSLTDFTTAAPGNQAGGDIKLMALSHDKSKVAVLGGTTLDVFTINPSTGVLSRKTRAAVQPVPLGLSWSTDDTKLLAISNMSIVYYADGNPPVAIADPINEANLTMVAVPTYGYGNGANQLCS